MYNLPEFWVHGGVDSSVGLLAFLDNLLSSATAALEEGHSIPIFPGIAVLSSNVHPMIVHFPIAFLTGFFLLDLLGAVLHRPPLRLVARWMLYLGALGALAAATAGLIAANLAPHDEEVHAIMEIHQAMGLSVASLASILAIWRLIAKETGSTLSHSFQWILAALLITALSIGADLGGWMVYGYGVGVHGHEVEEAHSHTHVQGEHE
jgi:uncharacterized membrane protein